MTRFTATTVVPAEPDTVAATLFDWTRDPTWRPAVTRMDAAPAGPAVVGQRLTERLRMAGLTFVTPTVITEVTDGSVAFSGGSGLVRVEGRRTVEPAESGTRITTVVDIRFHPAARLLEKALSGAYARRHTADLDRLVDLLAGAAAVTPTRLR